MYDFFNSLKSLPLVVNIVAVAKYGAAAMSCLPVNILYVSIQCLLPGLCFTHADNTQVSFLKHIYCHEFEEEEEFIRQVCNNNNNNKKDTLTGCQGGYTPINAGRL